MSDEDWWAEQARREAEQREEAARREAQQRAEADAEQARRDAEHREEVERQMENQRQAYAREQARRDEQEAWERQRAREAEAEAERVQKYNDEQSAQRAAQAKQAEDSAVSFLSGAAFGPGAAIFSKDPTAALAGHVLMGQKKEKPDRNDRNDQTETVYSPSPSSKKTHTRFPRKRLIVALIAASAAILYGVVKYGGDSDRQRNDYFHSQAYMNSPQYKESQVNDDNLAKIKKSSDALMHKYGKNINSWPSGLFYTKKRSPIYTKEDAKTVGDSIGSIDGNLLIPGRHTRSIPHDFVSSGKTEIFYMEEFELADGLRFNIFRGNLAETGAQPASRK